MVQEVEKPCARLRSAGGSRVSSKHQITIPIAAFGEAGRRQGDLIEVWAQGRGGVLITRVGDLIDEHAGVLRTGGELGQAVSGLRKE